jgi:probable addiction module antidote protein
MGKTSSYRESLLEALTDPEEAVAYLNAGLEDSLPAFLKALKNVTQAHQMTKVAKDSGVQRETLYRSLSEQGNPTLQTLTSVLGAMGLRMRVEVEVAGSVVVSGEGAAGSRGKRRDVGRAVA